jgi:hypothetical protein
LESFSGRQETGLLDAEGGTWRGQASIQGSWGPGNHSRNPGRRAAPGAEEHRYKGQVEARDGRGWVMAQAGEVRGILKPAP